MSITVADLQVRVRSDVREGQRGLQQTQAAAERSAAGAAGAWERVRPRVSAALTGIGTAAGFAFAGTTESAAQLADEMANVQTVVPDADIAGLTNEVQELSRASGVGTSDLTAGLYDLVSAGVSAEEAMSVLAASTNLAIGGLGTTASAADVVTSALNAYGEGADQAGRVTDIFALAIQKGKVTADEIGASIANIAPVAAAAGVSLEEVGAGYAALTAKGVPAAQAATQMRAAISALLTPNETLNRIQEQTGQNFAELARTEGLGAAMEQLRQAFAENGDALAVLAGVSEDEFPAALRSMQSQLGLANSDIEKLTRIAGEDGAAFALQELARTAGQSDSGFARALGSIEAYQFALNTTGGEAESFQATVEDMFAATGTAAEQAAIKMDSPVEQGKRLFATFATFLQDVGAPFASSLGPILFGLNQLSPAMRGLISPARLAGGALGNLGTRVLPAMLRGISGIGGKLLPAFAGMFGSVFSALVPLIAGPITGLVSAIGGLLAAALPLLAAALPFLLIAAIVAAIVVLIANPEIREKVFEFIGGILEAIGEALAALGELLGSIFGGAFDFVAGLVGDFIETITAPFRAIADFFAHLFDGAGGPIQGALDIVTGIVKTWIDVVTFPIRTLISIVEAIFNNAPRFAKAALDTVVGIVRDVVNAIVGIFRGIVGAVQSVFSFVSGIISNILGAIGTVASAIGGLFGGGARTVRSALPKYQEGAWMIPETQPALVHKGEMILPPDLAESFRRFLGGGGAQAVTVPTTAAAGGPIINQEIVVPITGLLRAERPGDVADALRRVAQLGYLTPPGLLHRPS